MNSLLQDIRFGARMLGKSPGFTMIALITLALGIGANTALFSVVDVVLNMPQQFVQPEELFFLRGTNEQSGSRRGAVSAMDYLDWRDQADSFQDLAALHEMSCILTGRGEPERLSTIGATANLLPMLGMDTQFGRLYREDEAKVGADRVVLISDKLWQRKFARSPDVLGQTLVLHDSPFEIIGVLTPRITRAWIWDHVDLWAPLGIDPAQMKRSDRRFRAIARLKPDVTVEQAQTEMDGIARRLAEAYPDTNEHRGVWMESVVDWIYPPEARLGMRLFLGAAGLILLIACANLASLQMVRASSRSREIAIRSALGAGRGRVIRQLLTESMLLALIGGVLGLLIGLWGVDLLVASFAESAPMRDQFGLNREVLGYTFLMSMIAAVAFGLTPAMRVSRLSLNEALKEGTPEASPGRRRHRLRSALVVGQIAVALPLLICAALLIKSLIALRSVDLGFNPDRLLTMQIELPRHRYEKPEQWREFFDEAIAAVETLPGVEAVAAANNIPLGFYSSSSSVTVEGRPHDEQAAQDRVTYQVITPDYFTVLEIPLVLGRCFTDLDHADAEQVAIVNRRMAERYWPDEDAIGRRFRLGPDATEGPWYTVVGIVGDACHFSPKEAPPPQMYFVHQQQPKANMIVVARTAGQPMDLVPALRSAIDRVDPDQPFYAVGTMNDLLSRWVNDGAVVVCLIAGLGGIALSLACVGLYGVMSCTVAQRTHEIGVRMALGAAGRDILRLVLGRCFLLAVVAVLIGLAASVAVAQVLRSVLFEVSPADPSIYGGVVSLLLAVALLAGYLPARRATRVDPMVALRYE